MYSMPQQAVTNGYWKSEYLRAQPSPFDTIFSKKPSASSRRVVTPPASSTSNAIARSPQIPDGRSLPLESALLPDVHEADHQGEHEDRHGDEARPGEFLEQDRPGIDEDCLDIEHDEEQRNHVELHAEPLARRTAGL